MRDNGWHCIGGFFADQTPILKMEDAVAIGKHAGIVSDHHNGAAVSMGQPLQKLDDSAATGGIERRGGFVGQEDRWIACEGAGNGHALLLSAA